MVDPGALALLVTAITGLVGSLAAAYVQIRRGKPAPELQAENNQLTTELGRLHVWIRRLRRALLEAGIDEPNEPPRQNTEDAS